MCKKNTDCTSGKFDFICKYFHILLNINIIGMLICLGFDWSAYSYFKWIIPFISKFDEKAIEWVAIFGATWGVTITIIVFILDKFNELTYGITLRKFLQWRIKGAYIRKFLVEYCASLVLLMICYFKEWYIMFLYLQIVNILELFSLIGFILIYAKREEVYLEIKRRTREGLCVIISDMDNIKAKSVGLPLVNLLQAADYDKGEDEGHIIDILTEVCIEIANNNPIQNHIILKYIIINMWNSEILNSEYRLNNMVYLIQMVLQNVEKKIKNAEKLSLEDIQQKMTAVSVGILIPMVESGTFIENSKNFSDILNAIHYNYIKSTKILILLYAEFLACYNDKNKQRDVELSKLELSEIYPYSMEDKEYIMDADQYWYVWNKADGQVNHHIDRLYSFKKDYLELRKKDKFGDSYIISKLKLLKG